MIFSRCHYITFFSIIISDRENTPRYCLHAYVAHAPSMMPVIDYAGTISMLRADIFRYRLFFFYRHLR